MLKYTVEYFRNEEKAVKTERANAKINLYLDIVSRRENGYHDLYTVMQTVSLCDLVTVDYKPSIHTNISMRASGNDKMPLDCRNLAWRAAELFLQRAKRSGEVCITIEKHIPMAAGLAGGSTDAAAVFRALNSLCGSPLSTEELCELGARLGADVPFCILGGCAIAEGIGDRLTPIHGLDSTCALVVACMGEGVSTPWAYGELDTRFGGFLEPRSIENGKKLTTFLQNQENVSVFCADFYNIFETVVPSVQECVNPIKDAMCMHGAIRSMMSGSGPSVFGIFEDREKASTACEVLRSMGADAFVCHPV